MHNTGLQSPTELHMQWLSYRFHPSDTISQKEKLKQLNLHQLYPTLHL